MSDYTKFSVNYDLVDKYLAFCSSFTPYDMRSRSYPVAGFIVPFKCYELKKQEKCKYTCTNVLLTFTGSWLDRVGLFLASILFQALNWDGYFQHLVPGLIGIVNLQHTQVEDLFLASRLQVAFEVGLFLALWFRA